MTPQSFLTRFVHMEDFFKDKRTIADRNEYQRLLCDLTDKQWEETVDYALRKWEYPRVPPPAKFLAWAGVEPETPAEAAQRTRLEGAPVLGGAPLADTLNAAEARGSDQVGSFWASKEEEFAYLYEAEAVLREMPVSRLELTDLALSRIELISERAQAHLKKLKEAR